MSEQQIDITKLSVTELKALAYELVVQVETARQNLSVVQQELAKRAQAPKPDV
jgi:hypothetical protein